MVYILVILIILALSIWLWGQETVKIVIKWLLGFSILLLIILWADNYSKQKEKEQKEIVKEANTAECYKKHEQAREALPDCARYITRYEDEKKNNCKINWSLQNDEGIKGKQQYDTDEELDFETSMKEFNECNSSQ